MQFLPGLPKKDKRMTELKKPEMRTVSYWVFREVINYIEKKYDIKTDEYTPKAGFTSEQLEGRSAYDKEHDRKPYLCFWHWITDTHEIHNGCTFTLWYDPEDEYVPEWVKEILEMIFNEFEPEYGELDMHVSW